LPPSGQDPIEQTPHAEGLNRLEQLAASFEQRGLNPQVLPLNAGEFYGAILFPKKEALPDSSVRVFRGVNHLDTGILDIVPYSARTVRWNEHPTTFEETKGRLIILEELMEVSDTLAHEPTYENLLQYTQKARPLLSATEQASLDRDLRDLEDSILKGESLRKNLAFEQVKRHGAVPAWAICPVAVASYDPMQAVGYTGTKGVLLVIDAPITEIEDLSPESDETGLKGRLDPKYISAAVFFRRQLPHEEKSDLEGNLKDALKKVNESLQIALPSKEETEKIRREEFMKNEEWARNQQKKDLEEVAKKRSPELLADFQEVGLGPDFIKKESEAKEMDVYSVIKLKIFDFYMRRLSAIAQKREMKIESYTYREKEGIAGEKNFNRDAINEIMLKKLRETVLRLEKWFDKN